jgi:hypothetical protein
MFQHSYESYLSHAYPYDELRPLTCDGVDTWGSYSLTLIDALDTLAVMGNFSEFNRSANPTFVFEALDLDGSGSRARSFGSEPVGLLSPIELGLTGIKINRIFHSFPDCKIVLNFIFV